MMDGQTDRPFVSPKTADGPTDGGTLGWTDRQPNQQIEGKINGQTDKTTGGQM